MTEVRLEEDRPAEVNPRVSMFVPPGVPWFDPALQQGELLWTTQPLNPTSSQCCDQVK